MQIRKFKEQFDQLRLDRIILKVYLFSAYRFENIELKRAKRVNIRTIGTFCKQLFHNNSEQTRNLYSLAIMQQANKVHLRGKSN